MKNALLTLWIVVACVVYFRQFTDLGLTYLSRLLSHG